MKNLSLFCTCVFIVTLLFLFADVYRSNTALLKYLHVSSRWIVTGSIILLSLLRIFYTARINSVLSKINIFLIFPVTFVVSLAATFTDHFTYTNFVYSVTKIQYTQLFLISVFSFVVYVLQKPNEWYKNNFPLIIFSSSILLFDSAIVISLFSFDVFRDLSKEDHLFENAQFFSLIFSSFLSFSIAKEFFSSKHKMLSFIFVISALALIFIAGDEISWGQRFFNFVTPEMIARNNIQQEVTVHNLSVVGSSVSVAYILIGLFGSVGWIVQSLISKLKQIPYSYFIPPWFVSFYFFFGFLFNFINRINPKMPYGHWAEFAELMLYLGIMFTLLSLKLRTKNT